MTFADGAGWRREEEAGEAEGGEGIQLMYRPNTGHQMGRLGQPGGLG